MPQSLRARYIAIAGLLLLGPLHLAAIVTAGDPDQYFTPFGRGWDGVASLEIIRSTTSLGCSGILLSGGRDVLTAAHCVADSAGNPDVFGLTALFETSDAIAQIEYAGVRIYPGYSGDPFSGNDLAIVRLSAAAPPGADRYAIYKGRDELGRVVQLAGYGATGRGREDDAFPAGQRRLGLNRLDASGSAFHYPGGDSLLLYDFDNGTPRNDGFGVLLGLHDTGEGLDEVIPSHGDSGGPTFINGAVAGLHSFSFRLKGPDVDGVLNQSFGEFGADVRLSTYAGWIDSQTSVPEPSTMYLLPGALCALMLHRVLSRRRRTTHCVIRTGCEGRVAPAARRSASTGRWTCRSSTT